MESIVWYEISCVLSYFPILFALVRLMLNKYPLKTRAFVRGAAAAAVLAAVIALKVVFDVLFPFNVTDAGAVNGGILREIAAYLIWYAAAFFCTAWMFQAPVSAALFASLVGLNGQHLAAELIDLVVRALQSLIDKNIALFYILYTILVNFTGFLIFFVLRAYIRHAVVDIEKLAENRELFTIAVADLFICICLSVVATGFSGQSRVLGILCTIFSCMLCLFVYVILFGLCRIKSYRNDMKKLEDILYLQRKEYETIESNLRLINIYVHDQKYRGEEVAEDSFFEKVFRTGNAALDTVLTSRSMLYSEKGIRMHCILDGKAFSFIESPDLYALFGNILDNAAEAAGQVENREKRIIEVKANRSGGFLVLEEINYYKERPIFSGKYPLSTKKDGGLHGYGIKSIEQIVLKYGGAISFTFTDVFHLTIVFPL